MDNVLSIKSADKMQMRFKIDFAVYALLSFTACFYICFSAFVKRGDGNIQLGYEWIIYAVMLYLYYKFPVYRTMLRTFTFIFVYLYLGFFEDSLFSYDYSRLFYSLICIWIGFCIYKYKDTLIYEISEKRILCSVLVFLCEINFWLFPLVDIYERYGIVLGAAAGILMYIWTYILFACMLLSLDMFICYLSDKPKNKNERISWKTSFLLMLFAGLFWSVVYYPGIFSPDVASIYNSAKNFDDISLRSDIHSFLYVIIQHLLFSFPVNYFALVLLLVLAFSIVWGLLARFLSAKGLSSGIILTMTIIWVSFPANVWMMISSWKDEPFTTCMLLVVFLLAVFVYNRNESVNNRCNVLLAIALFGMAAFRSNGQAVLMAIVVLLVILSIMKRNVRVPMISAILALTLLALFKGPVFYMMNVSGTPQGFVSLPFLNAVWEASYKGRPLSDKTIDTIEDILPIDEFNEAYKNEYLNYGAFSNGYLSLDTDSIVEAYMEVSRRYPFDTFIARMKKTYNIWAVFPSSNYIIDTNYEPVIRDFTEDGGENWKYLDMFEPLRRIFKYLYISPNFFNNIWYSLRRCGLCIVLWRIFLYHSIREKKMIIMLPIFPAIANTAALMIGCCFQDCAYFYPMIAVTIPYILIYVYYFALNSSPMQECTHKEERT